jgi:hypothetical protein
MFNGDHWSEPARCHRCGAERSTHDDGYCEAIVRVFSLPAKKRVTTKKETSLEAFKREGEPNGGHHAE